MFESKLESQRGKKWNDFELGRNLEGKLKSWAGIRVGRDCSNESLAQRGKKDCELKLGSVLE